MSRMDPRLCAICRGRGFCGLAYCPIIARSRAVVKLAKVSLSRVIEGSSPPSVFVGRHGYPYVRAGISAPPLSGDTVIYDHPESWITRRIEEILDYRWSLITGYTLIDVKKPFDKLIEDARLIVLSSKPVDVVMELAKPPAPIISFSDEEPPQGPRSPLEKLRVLGNPSVPRPVEKVYSDIDLLAYNAVVYLYRHGVPVSHIQKIFSVGALGVGKERRLVPTRWSITAVDSIISRELLKEVKAYSEVNEIEVYSLSHHDNFFTAVLYPAKWSFEWMEAWWPGSTWNPGSLEVVVEGDYEDYHGRTSYPEIGGCYYASMLATLEHLSKRKKQATAILLREIYPGFNLPIGVWFVRESVREMYKRGPVLKTNSLRDVVEYLDRVSRLGAEKWFRSSRLLQRILKSKSIRDFFVKGG
ncbi:MAG: Nre family DNA repair protein [Desulfurococcus sp.]|nr:Nre family DNA repair protein [Desulfurococcus sp.]